MNYISVVKYISSIATYLKVFLVANMHRLAGRVTNTRLAYVHTMIIIN